MKKQEAKDVYKCTACGAKQIVYPDRAFCNKPLQCSCGGNSAHYSREWQTSDIANILLDEMKTQRTIEAVILFHHPLKEREGCKSVNGYNSIDGNSCSGCGNPCAIKRRLYLDSGDRLTVEGKEYDMLAKYIMRLLKSHKRSNEVRTIFEIENGRVQTIKHSKDLSESEIIESRKRTDEIKEKLTKELSQNDK